MKPCSKKLKEITAFVNSQMAGFGQLQDTGGCIRRPSVLWFLKKDLGCGGDAVIKASLMLSKCNFFPINVQLNSHKIMTSFT